MYCGWFNLLCNVRVCVCVGVYMCGCVYMGVFCNLWVLRQLRGCFSNTCIGIYCVLYCLYCVFVLFRLCTFIFICFVYTGVRAVGRVTQSV